jgi:hypothetical protein
LPGCDIIFTLRVRLKSHRYTVNAFGEEISLLLDFPIMTNLCHDDDFADSLYVSQHINSRARQPLFRDDFETWLLVDGNILS